jgi:hypothetical protein
MVRTMRGCYEIRKATNLGLSRIIIATTSVPYFVIRTQRENRNG